MGAYNSNSEEVEILHQRFAGVLLKDGQVGTDAAREAKIQETLKKMGVKAARREVTQSTVQQKRAQIRTLSERINSIFDVSDRHTENLMVHRSHRSF